LPSAVPEAKDWDDPPRRTAETLATTSNKKSRPFWGGFALKRIGQLVKTVADSDLCLPNVT